MQELIDAHDGIALGLGSELDSAVEGEQETTSIGFALESLHVQLELLEAQKADLEESAEE